MIIASLFERRAAGVYHNTAAIIDADGSLMGVYRKMHIPDDPLFYEKFYFTPGDTGFIAWKTKVTTIGTLVCWDQWFPEGARLTAMQGAEILFYPTAIGWHPSERKQYGAAQHDSWEVMQRSHAIANGCYVCVPNRIGHEIIKDAKGKPVDKDGIVFWGQSFVASPDGQVVKRAPVEQGDGDGRRLRSREGGIQPHALAVPARSPHRRLRRSDQALQRLAPGRPAALPRLNHRCIATRLQSAVAVALAVACSGTSGPTGPSPPAASLQSDGGHLTPRGTRSSTSRFAGDFPTGQHVRSRQTVRVRRHQRLPADDVRRRATRDQVDGHPGYDWRMPEGTPLLAVADGLVMYAGLEAPFHCPPLGRTVQAIYVQLRHRGPDGVEYISVYGHLSRVGVTAGRHHRRRHDRRLVRQHRLQRHAAPALRRVQGRDATFTQIDPYGWHASIARSVGGRSSWRGQRVAVEGRRGAAHTII